MSTPGDIDKVKFPHPTLTRMHQEGGRPTYRPIAQMHVKLNANAAAIHSNGGNGKLRYLALTIPEEKFLKVSEGVAWEPPTNPGTTVTHQDDATGPQMIEDRRLHDEATNRFLRYKTIEAQLRNQIIGATDPMFIEALRDPLVGFGRVTPLELLKHLYGAYGRITAADLEDNLATMSSPWSPPTPIEQLFRQIDDGRTFAAAGNDPISERSAIRIGYKLIVGNAKFALACREWRLYLEEGANMKEFKQHFRTAAQDLTNAETTGGAGYGSQANAAYGESGDDEVATAFANLMENNAKQEAALAACQTELADIKAKMSKTRARPGKWVYCWTHGFTKNDSHTSKTCRYKKEGHQDEAQINNTMGGNEFRKEQWMKQTQQDKQS